MHWDLLCVHVCGCLRRFLRGSLNFLHSSCVPASDPHIVLPLTDARMQPSVWARACVHESQKSRTSLMFEIICTSISSTPQCWELKAQQKAAKRGWKLLKSAISHTSTVKSLVYFLVFFQKKKWAGLNHLTHLSRSPFSDPSWIAHVENVPVYLILHFA